MNAWPTLWDCFVTDVTKGLEEAAGRSTSYKDKSDLAIKWLSTLTASTRKWAAIYTWDLNTLGANSSQRAEAIFSGLKSQVHSSLTLIEACQKVESYNSKRLERLRLERLRSEHRGLRSRKQCLPQFMTSLLPRLTPYARNLQLDQYYQLTNYQVEGPVKLDATHHCARWLLGRGVAKEFEGTTYLGTVERDPSEGEKDQKHFLIKYSDGDEEHMNLRDLRKGLLEFYNATGAASDEDRAGRQRTQPMRMPLTYTSSSHLLNQTRGATTTKSTPRTSAL